MSPPPKGVSAIRDALAHLTNDPGIYRMLDQEGNALYIGKAKHLKNRVSNYANLTQLTTRLQRMVIATERLEVITTRSEAEALLLEADLIKKHRPRYNILLKDDKSFPYILFSGDHPYPRISKYRGAQNQKGDYFGPFVSASAVNEMLSLLQKAFLLRPCSDNIFKNRTRPCLQYQIKRCSAPCVSYISEAEYAGLVREAKQFLTGHADGISAKLEAEMEACSEVMQFEKAAVIRDRLRAITHIQRQHSLALPHVSDADIFALARSGDMVCVQVFSWRAGRNFGSQTYFPGNTADYSDGGILEALMGRFYQTQPVPNVILLSHPLQEAEVMEAALTLSAGRRVEVIVPRRGDKKQAVEMALNNARESLARHVAEQSLNQEMLAALAEKFGLDQPPGRIEVYDNSHISGTNAIGAMVVATPEGFDKKAYRTFTIKLSTSPSPTFPIIPPQAGGQRGGKLKRGLDSVQHNQTSPPPNLPSKGGETFTAGDDYGMLREVLTRRLKRSLKEDEASWPMPDLLLIDGGAGQLSAVTQVLEELGVADIPVATIAKGEDRNAGREWFHLPGKPPFQLPVGDPLLHYLQRLRDEAHRFAIGTHRNKRSKNTIRSELDSIPGIGGKRKKALLLHFGSVRDIASASAEELAQIDGINTTLAKQIYDYFH